MLTKNALDAICVALQHGDDKELVVTPRYIRELVGTSCHISPPWGSKKNRSFPQCGCYESASKFLCSITVTHETFPNIFHGRAKKAKHYVAFATAVEREVCGTRICYASINDGRVGVELANNAAANAPKHAGVRPS